MSCHKSLNRLRGCAIKLGVSIAWPTRGAGILAAGVDAYSGASLIRHGVLGHKSASSSCARVCGDRETSPSCTSRSIMAAARASSETVSREHADVIICEFGVPT